jgi:hypothetical protein
LKNKKKKLKNKTHQNKTNPYAIDVKQIKSENLKIYDSFTLPEININTNEHLQQYYPYFYKTKLIEYKNEIVSNKLFPCLDSNCEMCDPNNRIICGKCMAGYFLLENKCYIACPDDHIADIFKRICIRSPNTKESNFI